MTTIEFLKARISVLKETKKRSKKDISGLREKDLLKARIDEINFLIKLMTKKQKIEKKEHQNLL